MIVQKGPLLGGVPVIMLRAHHHDVDAPKVKAIPLAQMRAINRL